MHRKIISTLDPLTYLVIHDPQEQREITSEITVLLFQLETTTLK